MPVEWETVAISVAGAVLSPFLVEWLRGRNARPVTESTANNQNAAAAHEITAAAADVSSAAGSIVDKLSKRLEAVEHDAAEMRAQQRINVRQIAYLSDRVATLTTGVRVLSSQIVEMGAVPRWEIPPEPDDESSDVDSC